MKEWTMREWIPGSNRWIIEDGKMMFEIHQLLDGSCRRDLYPDGVIVSPEEATKYAHEILAALNGAEELQSQVDTVDELLFGMDEPLTNPVDIDGLNTLFLKLRAAIKGEK